MVYKTHIMIIHETSEYFPVGERVAPCQFRELKTKRQISNSKSLGLSSLSAYVNFVQVQLKRINRPISGVLNYYNRPNYFRNA